MTTKINFSEWLEAELNQRGWRQAELVRRSGLSVGHVSRIITSQRLPGSDAIQGIARAFKMPVEDVMRQAGLLPSSAINSQQALAELHKKIDKLSESDRQIILAMVNRIGG
ncbi:MAG: helix-turn-helix domain-containing protein [Anaerolineae bacterium]|jgi:transcriptional regulator with XRE-family HTH domain